MNEENQVWVRISKIYQGTRGYIKTYKMKCPGGWLVMTYAEAGDHTGGVSVHQVFVPEVANDDPLKKKEEW